MANEIYEKSWWGSPEEGGWGGAYFNLASTSDIFFDRKDSLRFTPASSVASGQINANRPLDQNFTFTRASTATFVGSDGLLQTAASGVPRIDYLANTDSHILLEPSRTNILEDSNDLDNGNSFIKVNAASFTQNVVSPTGSTDGWTLLTQNKGGNGQAGTRFKLGGLANFDIPIDEYVTVSIFAKKNDYDSIACKVENFSNLNGTSYFHLHNGTLGTLSGNHHSHKIEDYGNGWYRLSLTVLQPSGATDINGRFAWLYATSSESTSVPRTGTETGYWYGGQIERASYSTSYIETTGASATRVTETAADAGTSTLFNDSEGVLFIETAALSDDTIDRYIGITDGTASNRVLVGYSTDTNRIRVLISDGGVLTADISYDVTDRADFSKIAVKYKENDVALWVDGVERATDTSATMPSGLDELDCNSGAGASPFYGKIKQIKVYKEALTDTQLQNLTS